MLGVTVFIASGDLQELSEERTPLPTLPQWTSGPMICWRVWTGRLAGLHDARPCLRVWSSSPADLAPAWMAALGAHAVCQPSLCSFRLLWGTVWRLRVVCAQSTLGRPIHSDSDTSQQPVWRRWGYPLPSILDVPTSSRPAQPEPFLNRKCVCKYDLVHSFTQMRNKTAFPRFPHWAYTPWCVGY